MLEGDKFCNNEYLLGKQIGKGSYGEVRQATRLQDNELVAVKLLFPNAGDIELKAFQREISIQKELDHPNIMPVLADGEEEGRRFYIMPHMSSTLRTHVSKQSNRRLSPNEFLPYLSGFSAGLNHTHINGYVHNDLKPDNLFLPGTIGDYGASHAISVKPDSVFLTARYAAPERINNVALPGSDLYSLGVIVYETLTGERVFNFDLEKDTKIRQNKYLAAHVREPIPPFPATLKKTPTLEAIESIVLKALEKDPEKRQESVMVFFNNFEKACKDAIQDELKPDVQRTYSLPSENTPKKTKLSREELEKVETIAVDKKLPTTDQLLIVITPEDEEAKAEPESPTEAAEHASKTEKAPTPIEHEHTMLVYSPKKSALYAEKGFVQLEQEKYEQALASYEEAIRLNRDNLDGYVGKGEVLRKLHKYQESLKVFDLAIENNQIDVSILSGKAEVLYQLQFYEEAAEMFHIALQTSSREKSLPILRNLGVTYGKINEFELSEAAYTDALDINPNDSDALIGRAMAAIHLGDDTSALSDLLKAVQIQPVNSMMWHAISIAFGNLGKYEEALENCEEAIVYNPYNSEYFHTKGLFLKNLGRNEDAAMAFTEATKLNPEDIGAYKFLGETLYRLGQYEESLAVYEQALQLDDHDYESLLNKGVLLIQLDKNEEAIISFDAAIAIDDTKGNVFFNKAIASHNLKRYHDAAILLDKATILNPEDVDAYIAQANIMGKLERFSEALVMCEEALARQEQNTDALYNRGLAYEHKHQYKFYEAALATYQEGTSIDPKDPDFWNRQGIVLEKLKQYDAALEAIDKSLEIQVDNSEALVTKSRILCHLKKYDDALIAIDQALALDPDTMAGHYQKGLVHKYRFEFTQAEVSIAKGETLDPQDKDEFMGKGASFGRIEPYDELLQPYEKEIGLCLKDSVEYMEKAEAFRTEERFEEAMYVYNQAIQANPRNIKAHLGMALCLNTANRYTDSLAYCDKAIELASQDQQYTEEVAPQLYEAMYTKGLALQGLKEYEEAASMYEKLIHMSKEAKAYYSLSIVLGKLGRDDESLIAFNKATSEDKNLITEEDRKKHSNTLYDKALELDKQGKRSDAVITLNFAIEMNPNNRFAYFQKARILLNQANNRKKNEKLGYDASLFGESVQAAQMAITLGYSDMFINMFLGQALFELGEHSEAIIAYDNAIGFAKKENEAGYLFQLYKMKAESLRSLKKFEQALEVYEDIFSISPKDPEILELMRRVKKERSNERKRERIRKKIQQQAIPLPARVQNFADAHITNFTQSFRQFFHL